MGQWTRGLKFLPYADGKGNSAGWRDLGTTPRMLITYMLDVVSEGDGLMMLYED
jgi:hypothetical protein